MSTFTLMDVCVCVFVVPFGHCIVLAVGSGWVYCFCASAVRNLIRWRVNLMRICNATLLQYDECCSFMIGVCSNITFIHLYILYMYVCPFVAFTASNALFICNHMLLLNALFCEYLLLVCKYVCFCYVLHVYSLVYLFLLAPWHNSIYPTGVGPSDYAMLFIFLFYRSCALTRWGGQQTPEGWKIDIGVFFIVALLFVFFHNNNFSVFFC